MKTNPDLFDIGDVCQFFNLSESTVRRHIRERKEGTGTFPLPLFKSKCRNLWRRADITAWRGEADVEVVTLTGSLTSPTPPVQPLAETRKRLASEFGIQLDGESNN